MPILKLKLQVLCDQAVALGPGKADLLEHIRSMGSIAGAARNMGMSYRRAWQLVDVMNRCWNGRVVETTPGRAHGGARLTDFGADILARYRDLQRNLEAHAGAGGWHDLAQLIRDKPLDQQPAACLTEPVDEA